jgi:diadenylate cyclase
MGTRHRAGIGITEETDAISVIVSEETGIISVCVRGQISTNHDTDSLRNTLQNLLFRQSGKEVKRSKKIFANISDFEETNRGNNRLQ